MRGGSVGRNQPTHDQLLGAIALFALTLNIVGNEYLLSWGLFCC